MGNFLLPFVVAFALVPESAAIIRAKRYIPSQDLQNDTRNKRQTYPYGYGYAAQGRGYYYPQYSATYPTYGSYGSYYNMQPSYGGYGYYQSQYPQYQCYPYYGYYNNYYSCYGTGSYYQQPAGGGLQRDRWDNNYMMLGNLKLKVACKSRGCPGE
ncbi:unnamed protein product [Cylicocyclus nassatus]|uniref:Uncharacterized protein n=1 Tax=Cylicocyclus nassatus TaxID=53992 RepID=A0AA36DJJ2_CYLNA|nr:unnamed protein product [Cylicocyclus nassatus]